MTREWQPGDVAMVEAKFIGPQRAFFVDDDCWVTTGGERYDATIKVRPLVVIDPDDRQQVDRLMRDLRNNDSIGVESMQAALRSLITPPKPDEPLGLGAVVEDAQGRKWVRWHSPNGETHPSQDRPWIAGNGGGSDHSYAALNVTRVVSEGVTA